MPDTTFMLNPNLKSSSVTVDLPRASESQEPEHATPDGASQQNGARRKIWIDIDNSPHVPFFLPIIDELEKKGFEVQLTARNMYQVCELLDFFNLKCKVVGGHFGKNKALKVLSNLM